MLTARAVLPCVLAAGGGHAAGRAVGHEDGDHHLGARGRPRHPGERALEGQRRRLPGRQGRACASWVTVPGRRSLASSSKDQQRGRLGAWIDGAGAAAPAPARAGGHREERRAGRRRPHRECGLRQARLSKLTSRGALCSAAHRSNSAAMCAACAVRRSRRRCSSTAAPSPTRCSLPSTRTERRRRPRPRRRPSEPACGAHAPPAGVPAPRVPSPALQPAAPVFPSFFLVTPQNCNLLLAHSAVRLPPARVVQRRTMRSGARRAAASCSIRRTSIAS